MNDMLTGKIEGLTWPKAGIKLQHHQAENVEPPKTYMHSNVKNDFLWNRELHGAWLLLPPTCQSFFSVRQVQRLGHSALQKL